MTPGLAEALRNGDYWIVVLLTLLIAGATIGSITKPCIS